MYKHAFGSCEVGTRRYRSVPPAVERALDLTEKENLYVKEEVRGEATIARSILVQCPGHRTSLNVAVARGFDSRIAIIFKCL